MICKFFDPKKCKCRWTACEVWLWRWKMKTKKWTRKRSARTKECIAIIGEQLWWGESERKELKCWECSFWREGYWWEQENWRIIDNQTSITMRKRPPKIMRITAQIIRLRKRLNLGKLILGSPNDFNIARAPLPSVGFSRKGSRFGSFQASPTKS